MGAKHTRIYEKCFLGIVLKVSSTTTTIKKNNNNTYDTIVIIIKNFKHSLIETMRLSRLMDGWLVGGFKCESKSFVLVL